MKNFIKFLFSDSTVSLIIVAAFTGVITGALLVFMVRETVFPNGGMDPIAIIFTVVTTTVFIPVLMVTVLVLDRWANNKPLVDPEDEDKSWDDDTQRVANRHSRESYDRKKYDDYI